MAESKSKQNEAEMPTQMGGTFAERAGGKAPTKKQRENSTFASRSKQVKSGDAEDKSVASGETKSRQSAKG